MNAESAFRALAADLRGQTISHVWRGYGSAVFFEVGALTPQCRSDGSPSQPKGQISIGVEWSWRIEDQASILCGSWSEEELWEPTFECFRNASVKSCVLYGRLSEIDLECGNGLHFMSFSTTDGQPEWHIVDRRDDPERWFYMREGKLYLGDGSEVDD